MKMYIITGASSSGKTTTIKALGTRGFPVMHEAARAVLKEKKLHPSTTPLQFQEEVARRHYAAEKKIRAVQKNSIIFLDRGMYDNIAFCNYFGVKKIPSLLQKKWHYDTAFFLESLPIFKKDSIRIEKDLEEASYITGLIRQEYSKRNIPCITVPFMSIEKRIQFILRRVDKNRL